MARPGISPARSFTPSIFAAGAVLACLALLLLPSRALARKGLVNAYFLRELPSSYAGQEKFFQSLRDTGANTVILDLPLNTAGTPALDLIPDAVYLAHKTGLSIQVILPTRRIPGIISRHPDWEDRRFDLESGTREPSGMLDLFNEEAVAYLSNLVRQAASFSIDGILLGEDFYFAPVDGLGSAAIDRAKKSTDISLRSSELFTKVSQGPDGLRIDEFGPSYFAWTAIKRDRLLYVYERLNAAARAVNSLTTLGIPIPIILPMASSQELLKRYAYDMSAFQRLGVDYYWTALEYREMKAEKDLSFSRTVEFLSRSATSAVAAAKISDRIIIALPAMNRRGIPLAFTEIEEMTGLVRRAGSTGIAYIIRPDTVISADFMKKMFDYTAP